MSQVGLHMVVDLPILAVVRADRAAVPVARAPDPIVLWSEPGVPFLVGFCGATGTRTPDPRHAMAVLFQLSYSPATCYRERRSRVGRSRLEPSSSMRTS